jgi:hypothetical protein
MSIRYSQRAQKQFSQKDRRSKSGGTSATVWLITSALVIILSYFGSLLWGWYRFTTTAEIDQHRGVLEHPKLAQWDQFNARLPGEMRLWACQTLMHRERVQRNVQISDVLSPESCRADFDPNAVSGFENTVRGHQKAASIAAEVQRVPAERIPQLEACVADTMLASLSPEERRALDSTAANREILLRVNEKGIAAQRRCLDQFR